MYVFVMSGMDINKIRWILRISKNSQYILNFQYKSKDNTISLYRSKTKDFFKKRNNNIVE